MAYAKESRQSSFFFLKRQQKNIETSPSRLSTECLKVQWLCAPPPPPAKSLISFADYINIYFILFYFLEENVESLNIQFDVTLQ